MRNLYEQLNEYSKSNAYPFHMPGHKRQFGVAKEGKFANWSPLLEEDSAKTMTQLEQLYAMDITEIDGFDNLNAPEKGEVLWRMCQKAMTLYDSAASFPLVNGSTSGLMAAISACCNLSDEILMGRNCHKSVYRAAELLGLKTQYLYPDEIVEYGLFADLYVEHLKEELKKHPQCKCVVLTSPTYEGVILDIHQISQIVHEANAILIVDGAHGAHLPFVMEGAFAGADLVVQSLHKTLPALTQTAVLHVTKEGLKRVRLERVEDFVHLYQSTSPSYLLMGSMDLCFSVCQTFKEDGTFQAYWEGMKIYRENLQKQLQHLQLLDGTQIGAWNYDVGKLVILTAGTDITGPELMERLRKDYQLECEMASANYVVAMTSVCDSKDGLERLQNALAEIDATVEIVSSVTPTIPEHKKPAKRVLKLALATEINDRDEEDSNEENAAKVYRPVIEMDLRSAKQKASIWMDLSKIKFQLENNVANTSSLPLDMEYHAMISGGYVMCYPPGIPILCPGEKITLEVVSQIETALAKNLTVQGIKNGAILALM